MDVPKPTMIIIRSVIVEFHHVQDVEEYFVDVAMPVAQSRFI